MISLSRLIPAAAIIALLGACSSGGAGAEVGVTSGDDTCQLSITSVPAGTATLSVENTGSRTTENIGPGLTRDLTVTLDAGSYVTSRKPGMTRDRIRAPFTAS